MKTLFTSVLLIIASFTFAQNFEGTINYTMTYEDLPAEMEGMESMLPSEMSMKIKGDKVRIEQSVMGGSQIVIVDNENNKGMILMDMMGQKMCILTGPEDVEEKPKQTVKVTNETKKIAGYKCKMAIITDEEGNEVEMYFTDKLGTLKHPQYEEINGFPLEYTIEQQGMTITVTSTEVKKGKIKKTEFEKPDGYTEYTQDELQQMMGGGK